MNVQEKLKGAIAERPDGPFHFSDLYGAQWDKIWIGDKVKLGNAFQRAVADGEFTNVTDTGTKRGGGRLYIKKGRD